MFVLGSARLDPEKRLLITSSRTVALQRKPYLVLRYLIESRHRMVPRKELLDQFWDGQDVYDQSLSKAVGSIRKAFGETRDSSIFIETRWGLGYRYVGPFDEPASNPPSPASPAPIPSTAPLPASTFLPEPASLPAPAPLPLSPSLNHRWLAPSLFAAVVLAAALLVLRPHLLHLGVPPTASAAVAAPIRSLAVLPFTAGTNQQQDQYLGMGLADAVADKLSTASQLTIRSSATVRSILGQHPDPVSAGDHLRVQALVLGSLSRELDKLVINVRLVDSATHATLWSSSFNTDDTNIFATEASIAQQVSNALFPRLGASPLKSSSVPDTLHPDAYSDYMKAEFFLNTRTQNSIAKAIDLLNHAILVDPTYARAYAALAGCYQLQGFYHFAPPDQAYPRAKAAAFKALSLDNSLAEAHVALLSIYTDFDWDWAAAEREFRATTAIDPNYAVAYQYYGYALLGMGRGEDGLAAMKHAADLDPVSPSVQTSLGWAYFLMRHYDQAADQGNRVLELYPDFVPAHQLLGMVLGQMKLDQKSLDHLALARKIESDSTITPILIDYELARVGHRAQAADHLTTTFQRSHGASLPDYYLAAAWLAAGNRQQAQFFLDRAFHARSNWIIYLRYDPRFDDLRPAPTFQALVHRVTNAHPSAS